MNSNQSDEFKLGYLAAMNEIKTLLGFEGVYLPCTVEQLTRNLYEHAQAWDALSHLIKEEDKKLSVIIQSNRLARELQ